MNHKDIPITQEIPEGLESPSQELGIKTSQILYYNSFIRSKSNKRISSASSQTPSIKMLEYYTAVKMNELQVHTLTAI